MVQIFNLNKKQLRHNKPTIGNLSRVRCYLEKLTHISFRDRKRGRTVDLRQLGIHHSLAVFTDSMLQSTAMISQRNDVKSNAMAMRERERKSRTGFRPSRVATLCLSITLLRLAASSDPKRHLQIIGNNQMPPWIYLEELLSDWPSQSPSRENSIFPTAVVSLLPSVNDEKTSMMKTSQSASIVSSAPTHIEEATSPHLEMSEMQTITPTTTRQFDADMIASWSPSITPTSTASSSPSDLPTSFPTLQCHDQPLYRSPINNLTCDDHGGTNCVHWRILGLNTTQLAELIEKCPITCRIPCGHFLQYSISLGFSIAKVPGLMDAPTKGRLELVTMQHLLAYIRTKLDRRVAFEFDKVELVSQASVQETPNEHQQVRKAKANVPVYSSSLTIRMEFEGFAIGISQREVTDLLISGIESESYLIALQAADEFFSEAFMSSAIEQPVAPRQNKDSQEGASPAIITISSLFLILAFASGFWCCIHHRRSGTWFPKLNVVSRSYIDEENEFRPQVRFSGMGIRSLSAALRSPRNLFSLANTGRLLSFDDSRASTHHTGNGAPLLRLLASLSLSRSRSSTGMEESTHQTSEQGSPITENSQSAPIESLSPHSDDSEMEHPLSSIIPPMIVIDDIDGDMNLHSKPALNRDSPQVPGKIIKASTSLISALRKERGIGNDGIL